MKQEISFYFVLSFYYRLFQQPSNMKGEYIMKMTPVSSSNISSIGYEDGTLYVSYNSGGLYACYNVPESVYRNLMYASSHGSYLTHHVKGIYQYNRIG